MKTKDCLGDRMKKYEELSESYFMPGLPVNVRLDGRAFHTFCRNLIKPFDARLSKAMIETTKYIVQRTNALVGYTQSDEISLLFLPKENEQISLFGGRKQKLISTIASMATAKFNQQVNLLIPEKKDYLAEFDCRAYNSPTIHEAINAIRWREWDAKKNSISMAAHAVASNSVLDGLDGLDRKQLLASKGMIWDDFDNHFKYGTYVKRTTYTIELSDEQWNKLSDKAKEKTSRTCVRSKIAEINIPHVSKISNYTDVIVNGATPILYTHEELLMRGADV